MHVYTGEKGSRRVEADVGVHWRTISERNYVQHRD